MLSHVNKAGATPLYYSSSLYTVSLCLLCIAVHHSINLKWRCAKKLGPELTAPNFTLNWIQFVTFTTEDLEKPKTQKQLCLLYTSLLIVFRWTETYFFFLYKQTGLWMKMLSLIVCGVLIGVFCCCQQRRIDFITSTATVCVSMGGRGEGECCCSTV